MGVARGGEEGGQGGVGGAGDWGRGVWQERMIKKDDSNSSMTTDSEDGKQI